MVTSDGGNGGTMLFFNRINITSKLIIVIQTLTVYQENEM